MRVGFFLDRLFRRERLDASLDEEIRFHVAERAAELQRGGLSPEEARRQANLEFGSVENFKAECREKRRFHFLHGFFEDLRFGFRMLRRNPSVSLLALFCLTLGIGANAAVYSWVEGILLRPYPMVEHQERLMAVAGTHNGSTGEVGNTTPVSWPDFKDLERNSTMFDAFIVSRIFGTTLGVGNRAERETGLIISSNYFDALGVHLLMGRSFLPEEEVGRNAHPVTIVSYRLWKDRYHSDPNVIGKTQILNGIPHTIVGVAPEGFFGTFVGYAVELYVPISMQEKYDPPTYKLENRGERWIESFVKLKPGVSPAQAQQEISAVAERLSQAYPETDRNRGIKLFPLWQTPFNGAATMLPTLGIALGVVVFVLLITCANVSNLLLFKGLSRNHEMTIRVAIGARRGRLVRQLVTEGLILSVISAALGLVVAYWCHNLFAALLPQRGVALHLPGHIDARVLAVSAALCLLSTLLFAIFPALQISHVDLAATLKSESSSVLGVGSHAYLRSGLVLLQVALSFILLVGTGLLLQSLRRIQNVNPGFAADRVLTTYVDFASAGYPSDRAKNTSDQLIDRLQAIPGVESAAFMRVTPFGYRGYSSGPVTVDGFVTNSEEKPTIDYAEIGPGYLATMGIATVSGREFTRADNEMSQPVAIVNQTMAERFWSGREPVGSRLQIDGRWLNVVGVARTSKYRNFVEPETPLFYVPVRQSNMASNLVIRTSLPPTTLAERLTREVQSLDANLPVGEVLTMRTQIDRTMAPQRIALGMLGVFGALALVLASVGLYGVMSYTVTLRTREMGLRMALGATPEHLMRVVLRNGIRLTLAGMVVGIALALGSSRLLGYLLYRVSPHDPLIFAGAFGVMAVASIAACMVPASRAAKTDPLRALRS